MSPEQLPTTLAIAATTTTPWITWEPLTPANLGLATIGIVGLWMMRRSSLKRDKQLDRLEAVSSKQMEALDTNTESLKAMTAALNAQTDRITASLDAQTESLKSTTASLDANTATLQGMTANLAVQTAALQRLLERTA